MIDIKSAVKSALEFIKTLYPEDTPRGLLLEEVELSDDKKYWLITIGFSLLEENISALSVFSPPKMIRVYKIIKIDAETGQAHSMKIREP